jgi:hypothetical protein
MKNTTWMALALTSLSSAWAIDKPDHWAGLAFKGDFRVRGEFTDYNLEDVKDRNRGRFRLRLGLSKEWQEGLAVSLRLASGSGEPTSTNQSFDQGFSGKEFWIDQAFLSFRRKALTLGVGKFQNPFTTSDLLMDGDLNPEGFYQSLRLDAFFAHAGQMVVEEQSLKHDAHLLALQLGSQPKGTPLTACASYYHYTHLDEANLPSAGNTFYATEFRIVDLILSWKGKLAGKSLTTTLHALRNLAEEPPAGVQKYDTGWAAFFSWGKAAKKGDWSLYYKYAHLEPNAVVGAFTDSDFGFADKKGHHLKLSWASHDFLNFSLHLFQVDSFLDARGEFTRVMLDGEIRF